MLANARVGALLPIVDMDRAREFCGGTLGLTMFMQNDFSMTHACGHETMLTLYRRDTPTTADHTAVVWLVAGVEEVVKELSARGVVFEQYDLPELKTDERGIVASEEGKSAWFKLPRGLSCRSLNCRI